MLETYKKYVIVFFASALLVFLSIPVLNIIVDPARVLRRDFLNTYGYTWPNLKINTPFLKAAYLIDNQGTFDSVLFGSSRLLGIPLDSLGGNWYKFYYGGGGSVNEHLYNLKVLVSHGIALRNVWLMDEMLSLANLESNKKKYNRRFYPDSVAGLLSFYKFYLFRVPDKDFLDMLRKKRPLVRRKDSWLKWSGVAEPHLKQDRAHEASILNFKVPENSMNGFPWTYDARAVTYIQEAYALCKKNHIQYKFIMNPQHYKHLLLIDLDRIEASKRSLSGAGGFFDFTTLNHYATTNKYWREWWHFLSSVGEQMLKVLNSTEEGVDDFGVFVDVTNVEEHLSKVRKNILEQIPNILLYDKNVFLNESYLKGPILHRESLMRPNLLGKDVSLTGNKAYIKALVHKKEGAFCLGDKVHIPTGKVAILKLLFNSPSESTLTVKCFDDNGAPILTYTKPLRKGKEYAFVPLYGGTLLHDIHIGLEAEGTYEFGSIEVIELL